MLPKPVNRLDGRGEGLEPSHRMRGVWRLDRCTGSICCFVCVLFWFFFFSMHEKKKSVKSHEQTTTIVTGSGKKHTMKNMR